MIVENKKTGKQYTITQKAWETIVERGQSDAYRIIKEIVARTKSRKSEAHDIEPIVDGLPEQNSGEIQ